MADGEGDQQNGEVDFKRRGTVGGVSLTVT